MTQILDVALLGAHARAGDEAVGAPADGEADQARRHEQDHLGQEEPDHTSRAACAPKHLYALLMPCDLGENQKHLGARTRHMAHQITSASNPLIKTLKSLHAKKGR